MLNARALDRERELVRELKALDDYKTKLIATLSHELKSPLAAMLANIEYLQETVELDSGALAVLAAVDRGAVRLVRVVEDLLLLAKVGDPHLPLLTRPVNLPDVVDDVVNLAAIADQRRVKVSLEGEHDQFIAAGDPAELDIMVTNLLSNAIKYSNAESTVTLTLSRDDEWVVLSCQDHGIGIAPADRQPAVPRVLPLGAARGQGPARHRARADHRRPDRDPAPGPDRGRLGAGQGQHVPGVPARWLTSRKTVLSGRTQTTAGYLPVMRKLSLVLVAALSTAALGVVASRLPPTPSRPGRRPSW